MTNESAARKRIKTAAKVLAIIVTAALAIGAVGLFGFGWLLCEALPHGGCSP